MIGQSIQAALENMVFSEEASVEDYHQIEIDEYKEVFRNKRNRLLKETDWWAVSDRTMTQAETDYRQALRDVPQQAGFPIHITWPTEPE
jgi:hypothetical protein